MMDCCIKKIKRSSPVKALQKAECPKCASSGEEVKLITIFSLLKDCYKNRINSDLAYLFCENMECDVTYFSNTDNLFFIKDELKVKVTLKDKGLDVHVCYCFDYTRQHYLDELRATGDSVIIETIKTKMKDPGCFCETSNPQGKCCLANNISWLKEAKKIVGKDR